MGNDVAIRVQGLSKKYILGQCAGSAGGLRHAIEEAIASPFRWAKGVASGEKALRPKPENTEFWALKDVTFDVRRGEVVGIIGRNGAGKSTLLKVLSRITDPTEGRIGLKGRVSSLLEVGTGFHPELSGRENVFLNGAVLGMRQVEVRQKFDEIVAFAGVEQFLDTPVKRYSSGMYVRLAFAVAAHLEPEILIVDEVLAVGDSEFQKKCLGKMEEISTGGRTVLFVSHNMDAIMRLCSRAILLGNGIVLDSGSARDVVSQYTSIHASQPPSISFTRQTPNENARRNVILISADWPKSSVFAPWTIPFGERIVFSVSFQCLKAVKCVELGIALHAPSGAEIASSSSISNHPGIHLSPGMHTFSVSYDSLKLVPNNYDFGIGIKTEAGVEDYFPKAFSIDVLPSEKSSSAKTDTFSGYVVPDITYGII